MILNTPSIIESSFIQSRLRSHSLITHILSVQHTRLTHSLQFVDMYAHVPHLKFYSAVDFLVDLVFLLLFALLLLLIIR